MRGLAYRLETKLAQRGLDRRADPAEYIEAAGARVRVRDVGRGPLAVVFAPDPPNVLEHHDEVFEALAKHVRVIGLELPGFGFSSPPPGFRYSIEENRDIVWAVLDALGVERAVLAMSCVAGLISVAAAVLRPERVVGVIGVQSADLVGALAWARRVDPRGLVRTPVLGQLMVRLNRRRLAQTWYRVAAGDKRRVDSLTYTAMKAYDRGAAFSLASGLQSLARTDAEQVFDTLNSMPAAAVWGLQDRTHRQTERAALSSYLPRVEVIGIEDAGHFPDLEGGPTFRTELLRWMEKHKLG